MSQVTQHTLEPADVVQLVIALSNAKVRKFTDSDWHCWSGAVGVAYVVEFLPADQEYLREALGIAHWGGNCLVVLDHTGLTWNGWSDFNSYAWQVRVALGVDLWDGGTPTEVNHVSSPPRDGLTAEQVWRAVAHAPQGSRGEVLSKLGYHLVEDPTCPECQRDPNVLLSFESIDSDSLRECVEEDGYVLRPVQSAAEPAQRERYGEEMLD